MRISRPVIGLMAGVFAMAEPRTADGQSGPVGEVYAASDLEAPPKLVNPQRTALLIANAYPRNLKSLGITGQVQVEFVVNENGAVEASSLEVLVASTPAFGQAAKSVVPKLEFTPGKAAGRAVRTRVLLPLVFR